MFGVPGACGEHLVGDLGDKQRLTGTKHPSQAGILGEIGWISRQKLLGNSTWRDRCARWRAVADCRCVRMSTAHQSDSTGTDICATCRSVVS